MFVVAFCFLLFFLRAGSAVHCISRFPLPKTLVKTLAKNPVKNLAKNLTKNWGVGGFFPRNFVRQVDRKLFGKHIKNLKKTFLKLLPSRRNTRDRRTDEKSLEKRYFTWFFPLDPLNDFFPKFGHIYIYIYIVFYKESESEVKKCKILEPGGKN